MKDHGRIAGIPFDFRRPTTARVKERIWNPGDPHVFTPRVFGIGWDINLPSLRKKSQAAYYVALVFYIAALVNLARSSLRGLRRLKRLLRMG